VTDVPKAAITAGDGAFVSEFVETHCRITKDSFGGPVGDLLSLRPWQREMFGRLLARQPSTLQRRHRFGLVGVPRKNGKSAMIAGLALYGLLMEDAGAEVYSVAGDRDQARLVFGTAKRMVEMDAELSAVTKLYRDAIEDPASGSVYRAVSAEAPLKEGLSPTLTVVDEVHVINEDLWNVFALAMGARPEPLLVGITTAGARYDSRGRETICYRLWQYGTQLATGHEADPSFYFECQPRLRRHPGPGRPRRRRRADDGARIPDQTAQPVGRPLHGGLPGRRLEGVRRARTGRFGLRADRAGLRWLVDGRFDGHRRLHGGRSAPVRRRCLGESRPTRTAGGSTRPRSTPASAPSAAITTSSSSPAIPTSGAARSRPGSVT
jgi:hypothetical protein